MFKQSVKNHLPALIVANPGRMRDSLRTLLRAVPRIETVYQASDGLSASKIIVEHQPALVLLDSKLANNDIQSISRQIKTELPRTRCIILIDSIQQRWMAEVVNADSVLLTGFSAKEFFATVEGLLARSGTSGVYPKTNRPGRLGDAQSRGDTIRPLPRPGLGTKAHRKMETASADPSPSEFRNTNNNLLSK